MSNIHICWVVTLTKERRDPNIAGDLIFASLRPGLQVLPLRPFFIELCPREGDLEHSRSTDESIFATSL